MEITSTRQEIGVSESNRQHHVGIDFPPPLPSPPPPCFTPGTNTTLSELRKMAAHRAVLTMCPRSASSSPARHVELSGLRGNVLGIGDLPAHPPCCIYCCFDQSGTRHLLLPHRCRGPLPLPIALIFLHLRIANDTAAVCDLVPCPRTITGCVELLR